ncbi:hypothetical protein [Mesorhizobium sp.]|uniref:hypothetical protein n=1 Tax=Mesorhizobium sp. TaxID=1871066 RepID=UPI000FE98555|nr:hypothetical protein [Mesorhizobium sp.]RWC64255.1 MAG: hypothetical protein EOS56_00795 [Mesorhizobium sp.]RWC67123.1 MAG: hypothetical protein EOS29_01625 [Mesorhizobium sp.]
MTKGELSTYRAKRDFTKTKEPSGERSIAKSSRLRLFIQKHAATRLHYDLRLTFDGEVMKKTVVWANHNGMDSAKLAA